MERIFVESSNLSAVAYDERSNTLEVEFRNGATYHYFDVPELVYRELVSASSHGQYFTQNIRGTYRYARQ